MLDMQRVYQAEWADVSIPWNIGEKAFTSEHGRTHDCEASAGKKPHAESTNQNAH